MSEQMNATPRQIECLVNIYLGDRWDAKRSSERYSWDENDKHAVIPAWGRPDRFPRVSGMGGAIRRMRDSMGRKGLLVVEYSPRGYRHVRDKLTAKALQLLKGKYPELPNIDEAIAKREAEEKAAADQAAADREEQEQKRILRAQIRTQEKIDRMAAILRDYQVRHTLDDGQLVAIWDRVIAEDILL